MSKRRKAKQSKKQQPLIIGAGIAVLVAVVAIVLLSSRSATVAEASQLISPSEYQDQFISDSNDHLLLDVRTPAEFDGGHINGAVNIAVEELANRLSEVPDDKPIVVYCRSGNRSAQASKILADAGYTGIYDLGGVIEWTAEGFPLE